MRILLDTQCWLWMLASPERFSTDARARLTAAENELFLSVASAWEIVIKHALGKLGLPVEPGEYVPSRLAASRVTPLPIHLSHALQVGRLPRHHRDPFDRLLIAQAKVEGLVILTAYPQFGPYDVETVRA